MLHLRWVNHDCSRGMSPHDHPTMSPNSAPAISLCEKWWPTVLERKISCSQWKSLSMYSQTISFFLSEGGRQGIFFSFVPKGFSSSFPDMFPIAPRFYHIWFAPKFNSPCIQSKMVKSRGAHLFLFCNWGSKKVLLLGTCPKFPNNCGWAN
jgi:hypothetical protein